MKLQIEGVVIEVGPVVERGQFSKRSLILRIDESTKWSSVLEIEFGTKRDCGLDDLHDGDRVRVEAELSGRQWKDRYFTSVRGWGVSVVKSADAPAPAPVRDDPQERLPF